MAKTTKIIIGVIVIVIICGAWYMMSQKFIERESIKIGLAIPLTGARADYGENMLRGIKGAIDEANANKTLSKQIDLVIEDSQADPKIAVNNYQLLKSQGIKVLFTFSSGVMGALNPLSKQDGIILMYDAMTSTFAKENDYAFKVYADASQEAKVAADWMRGKGEKLGVAYLMNQTAELILGELDKKIKTIKYGFGADDTDFRTVILKMKSEKIDGLMITGYANQDINFIKQAIELKYLPKFIILMSDGARSDVISQISSIIKESGIEYVTVAYGKENTDYVFGYDMAKVLIGGMKKCEEIKKGADDPECLKVKTKEVVIDGKSGSIRMNGSNDALVSPSLYVLSGDMLVPVQK